MLLLCLLPIMRTSGKWRHYFWKLERLLYCIHRQIDVYIRVFHGTNSSPSTNLSTEVTVSDDNRYIPTSYCMYEYMHHAPAHCMYSMYVCTILKTSAILIRHSPGSLDRHKLRKRDDLKGMTARKMPTTVRPLSPTVWTHGSSYRESVKRVLDIHTVLVFQQLGLRTVKRGCPTVELGGPRGLTTSIRK